MADLSLVRQIHQLAQEGKVALKRHAFIRMVERGISMGEVFDCLNGAEIIHEYPTDSPLASCLVLGTGKNRPLHAVVAPDGDTMLWVITVYEPSLDRWDEGFRTRRPST